MERRKHAAASTAQCMPRLWRKSAMAASARPATASASSLLQRLREVVLKLVLFSAISKSSSRAPGARPGGGDGTTSSRHPQLLCHHADSYRSEAVEDCIEFFKKSSAR